MRSSAAIGASITDWLTLVPDATFVTALVPIGRDGTVRGLHRD